jgi:hypothetical protein
MANHEMVKEAITEFKNCHNADISACFSNVCKVLSLAGKQERNDGCGSSLPVGREKCF